jgi:hypothetical protein
MFETIWTKIKSAAGPVGSIIEARVTALAGLVTAGIGFMDWSPLTSLFGTGTVFNQTQVMALGGIAFVKGIFSEITRRANDPLLRVQAAVDALPEVKKAKSRIKKISAETPTEVQ